MGIYDKLYQDPEYYKLSYKDQLYVRDAILKQKAPEIGFDQLAPQDQQEAYRQIVLRPPDLENKDNVQNNKRIEFAEAARQGDTKAAEQVARDYARNMGLKKLSQVTLIQNILDKVDPEGNKTLHNLMGYDDPDLDKIQEYYAVIQEETGKNIMGRGQAAEALGGIGDYLSWWITTGAIKTGGNALFEASKAGSAVEKMILSAPNNAGGRLVKWVGARAIPELGDSLRASGIGMVSQAIQGDLEKQLGENPTVKETLIKGSMIFGKEFVKDYLFFGALQLAMTPLRAAKGIFGKGYRAAKFTKNPLSEEEFTRQYKVMTSMLGVEPDDMMTMPKATQDEIKKNLAMSATLRNVDKLKTSSPEFQKLAAFVDGGFELEKLKGATDKWMLKDPVSGFQKVFNNFDDAIRKKESLLLERANDINVDTDLAKSFSRNNLRYEKVVTVPTEEFKPKTGELKPDSPELVKMLNVNDGKVSKDNVLYVARKLLTESGMMDHEAKAVKITFNGKAQTLGDIALDVGDKFMDATSQEKAIKGIIDEVENYAISNGWSPKPFQDFRDAFRANQTKTGFSPLWTKYTVEKLGGSYVDLDNGKVKVIADGVEGTFDSSEEAGMEVFKLTMKDNPDEVFENLRVNAQMKFGATLKKTNEGFELSRRGVQKVNVKENFETLDEVLDAHPEYLPKLPQSSMPDIMVTMNGEAIQTTEWGISGSVGDVFAFADNFTNIKDDLASEVVKETDTSILTKNLNTKQYVLTDRDASFRWVFNEPGQAYKQARQSYSEWEGMKTLAGMRGGRIEVFGGQWYFYGKAGTEPLVAPTKEALKKQMSELPIPEYVGKELSDIDFYNQNLDFDGNLPPQGDVELGFHEVVQRLTNDLSTAGPEMDASSKAWVLKGIGPMDLTMKEISKNANDPGIYDAYKQLRLAERYSVAQYNKYTMFVNEAMGKVSTKKIGNLKNGDAEILTKVMFGNAESKWKDLIRSMKGPKATEDQIEDLFQKATRLRTVLGRTPDEGMYKVLGLDTWKFLDEFLPQLRKMTREQLTDLPVSGSEGLQTILGRPLTRMEEQMSNHLRIDSMLTSAHETNILHLVDSYVRQGVKAKFMGPAVDAFTKKTKAVAEAGFKDSSAIMTKYWKQATGLYTDAHTENLEKNVKKIALKFYDRLEKKGWIKDSAEYRSARADVLALMNSLTVSATMAGRAWLPIRNSFQPYITLGPRIGADIVDNAVMGAAKNGEEIIRRLRAAGIVGQSNPIMQVFGSDPLRKFNNAAMKWYTSSDAWTRGVCYQAADDLLTPAFQRLKAGKIDMDRFLSETKIKRFDKFDQRDIMTALDKEGLENAKMVYTEIMAHETMFPYKTAENPDVFHGLLGRLFGGFGHYPVYYTANLLRGLSNAGNIAGKVAYGMTVLGTSAALYHGFKDVLGVNASNFIWYTPVQFSGGPWYQMLNSAMGMGDAVREKAQIAGHKLTGRDPENVREAYYTSKQDLSQFTTSLPRLVIPGSAALRSWQKSLEAMQAGDYITALKHGFSAPLVTKDF